MKQIEILSFKFIGTHMETEREVVKYGRTQGYAGGLNSLNYHLVGLPSIAELNTHAGTTTCGCSTAPGL